MAGSVLEPSVSARAHASPRPVSTRSREDCRRSSPVFARRCQASTCRGKRRRYFSSVRLNAQTKSGTLVGSVAPGASAIDSGHTPQHRTYGQSRHVRTTSDCGLSGRRARSHPARRGSPAVGRQGSRRRWLRSAWRHAPIAAGPLADPATNPPPSRSRRPGRPRPPWPCARCSRRRACARATGPSRIACGRPSTAHGPCGGSARATSGTPARTDRREAGAIRRASRGRLRRPV